MPSLLYLALSNAVLATLLAAFVVVVARFCRRPGVRHAMWLLVLLKLLTPPLVPISVMWPRSEESEPPSESLLPLGAATVRERWIETQPLPNGRGSDSPSLEAATVRERSSPPLPYGRGSDFSLALLIVWLGGALTWWTIAARRLRKFRRLLRHARPASADVQEQGQRLAVLLGLRRCPPIVFVSAPLSPMLWALGLSRRLLVPAELWRKLTAEQQDTLLAHELAHLRRGDHWVRRLELLVLGLYWWHPVVWWARRRLQEAEEECCDILVVAVLPDAAPAYASALVETVAFLSQTRPAALVGASGAGHVPLLKRRLTMILMETSCRKPSRVGFWIVLGLGALLLPLAPQAAWTEAPEEPQVPEATRKPVAFDFGFPVVNRFEADPHKISNCASCHQAPALGHDFHDKSQSWKQAHDDVARLLDELRMQRAQLQKTEELLKHALDTMKQSEPRFEAASKTSWNVTWAEALFDQRTVDFGKVTQGATVEHLFLMTNHGQHPVHITALRSSNACLTPFVSKFELLAGGELPFGVRLDTSKFVGDKTFEVRVQFDKPDRQEVVLKVRANSLAHPPAKSQSPERFHELEKKLDELRKEMDNLRREMQPDKPHDPILKPDRLKR